MKPKNPGAWSLGAGGRGLVLAEPICQGHQPITEQVNVFRLDPGGQGIEIAVWQDEQHHARNR